MAVGEGGVNRIITKFGPLLFGYEEFSASGVQFRKCNLL